MADEIATPAELDRFEATIDGWLRGQLDENPVVAAVERGEPDERRWYVRVTGEEKSVFSVWFTLGQRTLQYETYVMPAPEENHERLYEHLLRRNVHLHGAAFAIGVEDAIFLVGQVPVHSIDVGELDRILGSLYAYTELCFRPAMRIGYASKFIG
jgi:hypothetical protein